MEAGGGDNSSHSPGRSFDASNLLGKPILGILNLFTS